MTELNQAPTPVEPPIIPLPSPAFASNRRNGKVARLPKPARDQINQMIEDGHSYPAIIRSLGDQGKDLNSDHLSNWKDGGYQDFLREREWREQIRSRQESALELLQDSDPTKLNQVALLVATLQLFEAVRDPRPETLQKLGLEPAAYTRMVNALCRASRESLNLKKYSDLCAREAIQDLQKLDPNRELKETERNLFWNGVQRLFGFKPDKPIGPPLAEVMAKIQAAKETPVRTDSTPSQTSGPTPEPATASPARTSTFDVQPSGPSTINSPTLNHSGPQAPVTRHPSAVTPAAGDPASRIQDPASSNHHPSNHQSMNPSPRQSTTPSFHHSTTPASEELCYECAAPLPPLLPNGRRPADRCPACAARLYAPDVTFDHCPFCDTPQPITPNHERLSPDCRRCGAKLPPPGQRYVTHCPACNRELPNLTADGARISDRCPDCRTLLPLLEPIPPPSPTAESPPLATAA